MENLNKMTFEEKTDYLVARIDALTEKVEDMINILHTNNIQRICFPSNIIKVEEGLRKLEGDTDYLNQFLVGGGKNMSNTPNE